MLTDKWCGFFFRTSLLANYPLLEYDFSFVFGEQAGTDTTNVAEGLN